MDSHPLFKPCKCSGSIGYTHQDCLQSWLAVNNASKCELCGTAFQFANQYAPNTPNRLPAIEVLLGFSRNLLATWLPLWIRVSMAAALWLLVAPLATSFIYHGWMHGTMMSTGNTILQMKWNILIDELVSGAVLVALVLFSFLSLMSLVDFLRAEWHEPRPHRDRDAAARQGGGGVAALPLENNNNNNNTQPAVDEGDVDSEIWNHYLIQQAIEGARREREVSSRGSVDSGSTVDVLGGGARDLPTREVDTTRNVFGVVQEGAESETDSIPDVGTHSAPAAVPQHDGIQDENSNDENNNNQNDDAEMDLQNFLQQAERLEALHDEEELAGEEDPLVENNENNPAMERPNNNNDEVGGGLEDDPILDADLNIALDELLGVRGPLWIVVRNLLWLLAFNTLYLALFAFIPRFIGSLFMSIMVDDDGSMNLTANATQSLGPANVTVNESSTSLSDSMSNVTDEAAGLNSSAVVIEDFSLVGIFTAIEKESSRLSTTFRLNDFVLVTIGYTCTALGIILMRYAWILARFKPNNSLGNVHDEELRETLREINHGGVAGIELHHHGGPQEHEAGGMNPQQQHNHPAHNNNIHIDEDGHVALGVAVGAVLDAAVSIVKVGVLLFLKMFLLPVMLGFCLDLSTTSLFQRTLDEIILYAGRDLFSFLFLHWVAGISFMLLVTVSVLQLREVAHPNVLSHIIRPQEPQPDLLGNLLHDSLLTHAKRLFLSLVIYVLLLVLQIHVPVYLFVSAVGGSSTYWKLKFCYILTPRLQIPIELCIFHLFMLAFLEKNKNSIGEIQHYWLKSVCHVMDMGNSILPHEVEKFRFVGERPVFTDDSSQGVDPLWYELAKEPSTREREQMIEVKLKSHFAYSGSVARFTTGETNMIGRRIIRGGSDYIRLPTTENGQSVLLATRVGRYRLNRGPASSPEKTGSRSWPIEVWEEVVGTAISRPPEGWDDLGVGGADVQGRWAWDREKKSFIEEGVAHRTKLFPRQLPMYRQCIVVGKLGLLIVFSWIASTVASSVLLMLPLVVGRLALSLLRLPESYIHDPFCFAIGSSVIFPLLRRLIAMLRVDQSIPSRCWRWLRSARASSLHKTSILVFTGLLWFVLMPFLIGLVCDIIFFWTNELFVGQFSCLEKIEFITFWAFGGVVLAGWSAGCVVGLLTREFWMGIFINDVNRAELPRDPSEWQGSHGKISRFFDVWKAVVLGWEWDQVDKSFLFDECTLPILRILMVVLFVPTLVASMPVGWISASFPIAAIVKSLVVIVLGIHICMSCEKAISSWFDAIHQTARDDRYLIGQLLINYEE